MKILTIKQLTNISGGVDPTLGRLFGAMVVTEQQSIDPAFRPLLKGAVGREIADDAKVLGN